MSPPFVPTLLLAIAPLAVALILLGRPPAIGARAWLALRFAGWATVASLLVWTWPVSGLGLDGVKRLNLVVALAACVLIATRYAGRLADPRRRKALWAALATTSLVVHVDFFSFHGQRVFVHWHDVAHYVLGSKYFEELGYTRLYDAMLWAEAEATGGRLAAREARDLVTNELVAPRTLLERGLAAKERFDPQTWREFAADTAMLRERLGPQYPTLLRDHGFNPTPFWALLGGSIARWFPEGDANAAFALTLLDPLLLLVLFAAIARTRGFETMCIVLTLFGILFGATFGWIGGAFLRQIWLTSTVLAACALARGRGATAGLLLALATSLRVFPLLFAVAFGLATLVDAVRRRRRPELVAPFHARFWTALALGLVTMVGASALAYGGFEPWREFQRNLVKHHDTVAPNLIGLTQALAYRPTPETVSEPEFRRIERRREVTHRVALFVGLPLALLAGLRLARRHDAVRVFAFGAVLLWVGSNVAAYYTSFLLLLPLAFAGDRRRTLAIFGVEAFTWLIALFIARDADLYVARSILLGALFARSWTGTDDDDPAVEAATR